MDWFNQMFDSENNECPFCHGTLEYSGTIGVINYLRCRDCGQMYRQEVFDV